MIHKYYFTRNSELFNKDGTTILSVKLLFIRVLQFLDIIFITITITKTKQNNWKQRVQREIINQEHFKLPKILISNDFILIIRS